jgi:PAS domain S-box-containing protein
MRLRLILLVLSLLTFLSVSAGGFLYYSSLRESAFTEAERQALSRLEMIKKNLSAFLSENIKPARTLAGLDELYLALSWGEENHLAAANAILDHFKKTLDVDVCYLMDKSGTTIASSNRNDPDSFVGKNFAFRPYFQKAIRGIAFSYLALGTTSGKRGAYYSHPVYRPGVDLPLGIVVIKASIELIEKELGPVMGETIFVVDPNGVIFITNQDKWLYKLLWKKDADIVSEIAASRQFGNGPWEWSGLKMETDLVVDRSGEAHMIHQTTLDAYTGWKIIRLRSLKAISKSIYDPFIRISGPVLLILCILIGLAVFFLYQRASHEIMQRKSAETALRESEERYKSIYHNTPAMLHSVDPKGRLVSVSDHWIEAMGYQREEVIGKNLTAFLTEDSKQLAEKTVFPQFFKIGFCKDIPYHFVKKNGEVIDILLSAIGDRDKNGDIARSLAVSIDVTERNKAQAALQRAKEKLSRYSKDLELQVRQRTSEISSILTYTPAVVYMKDRDMRYKLVNTRYEELFHVENESIQGCTDYDILPKAIANQFRINDLKVLSENRSFQVEERIPQNDGEHIYLSVKFPVYDEIGAISGICGISTDITAVKKAQDQLRRLSASIMANQEKERSAIARELHDELGQVLTALRMDSVWVMERLKKSDPDAFERIVSMRNLIDKTIDEIRSMAFRLRPGVLDDLGLVAALELFTSDFEKRTGITCIFEPDAIPSTSDTVATAAYRIAQEALTNIARHSQAGHVDVVLESGHGLLKLSVADDGKGFSIKKNRDSENLGLAVMRERASLAGGRLSIQSEPGKGTDVYFEVPV